ncbi:S41 family peptidase [Clostridiaceae bacterium M8S5]|nr:S41 family peptidase [Clostridiaceae bacterium M8S5]
MMSKKIASSVYLIAFSVIILFAHSKYEQPKELIVTNNNEQTANFINYLVKDCKVYMERLNSYRDFIFKTHPKCTKEFIESIEDDVDKIYIKNYANKDYLTAARMLIALLKDGHSYTNMYKNYCNKVADFYITCYNNRIYIKVPSKKYSFEKGDEILQIDDINIDDILKKFSQLISCDNTYNVNSKCGNGWIFTNVIFEYLKINPNSFNMKIKDPNDNIRTINMSLVEYNPKNKNNTQKNNDYILNDYILYKNVGILRLPNILILDNPNKVMLSKFFEDVKNKGINTIIIDVSECPGGYDDFIHELFRYLPIDEFNTTNNNVFKNNNKYCKELFKGNIAVLTSNDTYSCGCILSGLIKYNKLGILIGENMGCNSVIYYSPKTFGYPEETFSIKIAKLINRVPTINGEKLITPDIMLSDVIEDYKGMRMYYDNMNEIYDVVIKECKKRNIEK